MVSELSHPRENRDNNFNFLRLVLALSVILSHSPQLIDGDASREPITRLVGFTSLGKLAVECFFLLSGYLIVQSWKQSPQAWTFLKKRILRIYPGFIVASVFCAFAVGPLGSQPKEYFANFWYGGFLKSVIFLHIPEIPPVFQGQPYPSVNGSMWSISLEFVCYAMVLALGSLGIVRKKILWLCATAVFYTLALYATFGPSLPDDGHLFSLNSPFFRLAAFFFIGGSFYLYREVIRYKSALAFASALMVLIGVFIMKIHYLAFAVAGAYLLFFLAFAHIGSLKKFERLPDVSYGVYLYGWPVQKLILWYFPATTPWMLFLQASLVSLLLGAASWYMVEKPFMRLKSFQLRTQLISSDAETKM